MPGSGKSYISNEITFVRKVLDQTEDAGFLSSVTIRGMGCMPRTLSETTAEAKSPLNENRCLGPSTKPDLGAGKLHFTVCPTIPDQGRGSQAVLEGDGEMHDLCYLGECVTIVKKKTQCIQNQ